MRNFRNFEIWKEAIQIVKHVCKIVDVLPENEKYGLRSQLCRAAVSMPSNISEGCSRSSESDFKRILEIAMGSSFELETQLIILYEIEFCSREHLNSLFKKIGILQEKINALISRLKDSIEDKDTK